MGYNARLSDLNAKFAVTKLRYLKKWNRRHVQIAQTYNKYLNDKIIKPNVSNLNNSVFHNYVIRIKKDELKRFLLKRDRDINPLPNTNTQTKNAKSRKN